MRVLITGGYGFIGSFVAERFYQEGCEVSILDDLSTGNPDHIDFKHHKYILSIEDPNCEELFRNGRFEVVVHLAAQVSVAASVEDPGLDTRTNVLGLTQMLNLSRKYGVRKFIMASSAAVYGMNERFPLTEQEACEPVSPYGISKWVGERYCRKWQELYGLETLCLRFSNVYGPRQQSSGEGGVVSVFLENAMSGKPLPVYGDGTQFRDFIYVRDVADAIFRAASSTLTGIYNLSTGQASSVNDLISCLERLHGPLTVQRKEKRQGDIEKSLLDNRAIRRDLDWAPRYELAEGLALTYEWTAQRQAAADREEAAEEKKKRPPSRFRQWLHKCLPYAENLGLFAITVYLSGAFADSSYEFLDFKLFYILILGMVHGNRQAITAVILSSALFTWEQLNNGRELISLMYDTEYFFQIAIYLFIGLVVGYTVERKLALISSLKSQLLDGAEKYEFLHGVYQETRRVKEELQQQILNNGDSFGKIYAVTKNLESLEPEKILASTVSVVESILKSDSVTIYTVNKYGSYLRLAARSNGEPFDAPKSLKVEEYPFIQEMLTNKQLYVNKRLQPGTPLLAAPVQSGGQVLAVIALHRMPFENFTLYYQNLFKVTVELVSSALSRALSYVEATASQRYLEDTLILKPEVFKEILDSKRLARDRHGVEYALLTPVDSRPGHDFAELSRVISRSLRETDYIGLSPDGKLLLLLSNSTREEADFVARRLSQSGVEMAFVNEELPYVG
ncbi:NAD-dependent epimerase/dehydratase family protein [Cohnella caldifontis]|uniref:NAD-dependent epimerase/dehydratase family protein n=1 Tax=Cohnella caldifontis TaxID=3027471 RepID=UPI0023ECDBC3|nr:NAD-dependent epimerase/dehydratase family protein [Cohnella sp. YIM B05605]